MGMDHTGGMDIKNVNKSDEGQKLKGSIILSFIISLGTK